MTQTPYYPPQYPQAPAQQYPPAPPVQQPYQQPYPQQPYGQQYPQQQPPAPQGPPPAQGSLDAFYSQPTTASGPSISWSVNGQQKQLGTTYAGIVARDVLDADVQQDSDPKTGQLKTYRDGRPKFFMKVPLKVQPSHEFPEGEATWYVRGQSREELTRAMAEVGATGSPKAGDAISITLVERRPSRGGGMPANIVQVRYQSAGGTGAPSPAPVPQQAAPAQPAQQFQPVEQVPQQWAQPVQQPQYAPPQPVIEQAQVVQQPYGQLQQQAPTQPVGPAQPPPPSDLNPDQQALLARLTGGQG